MDAYDLNIPFKFLIADPDRINLIMSGQQTQKTIKSSKFKKGHLIEFTTCAGRHSKLLGNATITDVIKLRGGLVIERQRDTTQDSWAKREGFTSFEDADKFFTQVYGPEWQGLELDVIYFKGDWIREVE